MARGRHRRRSGLLSRLLPQRRPSRAALLQAELSRARAVADATAATATAALVRAATAADAAAAAELRAARAETALAAARDEVAGLRADLAALREELVWAFAEGRLPVDAPRVVDVSTAAARPA
jgi:hypothetical protein